MTPTYRYTILARFPGERFTETNSSPQFATDAFAAAEQHFAIRARQVADNPSWLFHTQAAAITFEEDAPDVGELVPFERSVVAEIDL